MDLSGYDKRVRSGDCFICEMLRGGEPGAEHEVIYDGRLTRRLPEQLPRTARLRQAVKVAGCG
jgi:hypothetical protein